MSTLNMKVVRLIADDAAQRIASAGALGLCGALKNAASRLWYAGPDFDKSPLHRFTTLEILDAAALLETVMFDRLTPPDEYPELLYWWPTAGVPAIMGERPFSPREYRQCILPRLIALDLIVLIIEDDRRREMRRNRRAKR